MAAERVRALLDDRPTTRAGLDSATRGVAGSRDEGFREAGGAGSRDVRKAEALRWYEAAAENGNAEACFRVGRSYFVGAGVRQDMATAVQWFRRAAHGHPKPTRRSADACAALGRCLFNGWGVAEADPAQGVRVQHNVEIRVHACGWLRRARDRLDRPPTSLLGTTKPTHDELIAHLQTAGRRLAREYWTDGKPLFFKEDLEPVPEEFVFA